MPIEPLLCTRSTKTGGTCTKKRAGWPYRSLDPDPESCGQHFTDEEREQRRRGFDALDVGSLAWRHTPGEPACWSWPVTDLIRELLRLADLTPLLAVADRLRAGALEELTQGRCALCGIPNGQDVTDHDHATGLIRGKLCRGCNTSEGMSDYLALRKYRERNPYSMLGLVDEYIGWGS